MTLKVLTQTFFNLFVLHTRTCLDTEDLIARFIPVKPPNTAILYFEMVLPVFMDRMATDRVKYRVITLVGVQLDPRCYAYGLTRFFLTRDAKNKSQEKDILSHRRLGITQSLGGGRQDCILREFLVASSQASMKTTRLGGNSNHLLRYFFLTRELWMRCEFKERYSALNCLDQAFSSPEQVYR